LHWEQRDLAEVSKVPLGAIKRIESVPSQLRAHTRIVDAIRQTFEKHGVTFGEEDHPNMTLLRGGH
jgi:hypothetical protein